MGMMDFSDSLLQPRIVSIQSNTGNGITGGGSSGIVSGGDSSNAISGGGNSAALQEQAALDYNARLKQYKHLLKSITGPKGVFGGMNDALKGFGKSARAEINENAVNARGGMEQDLISRGLGNTTIRQTAMRGVDKDAQRAKLDLNDRLASQRMSMLPQQAGMAMQLFGMNPSLNSGQYIDLLTRLGASTGK